MAQEEEVEVVLKRRQEMVEVFGRWVVLVQQSRAKLADSQEFAHLSHQKLAAFGLVLKDRRYAKSGVSAGSCLFDQVANAVNGLVDWALVVGLFKAPAHSLNELTLLGLKSHLELISLLLKVLYLGISCLFHLKYRSLALLLLTQVGGLQLIILLLIVLQLAFKLPALFLSLHSLFDSTLLLIQLLLKFFFYFIIFHLLLFYLRLNRHQSLVSFFLSSLGLSQFRLLKAQLSFQALVILCQIADGHLIPIDLPFGSSQVQTHEEQL